VFCWLAKKMTGYLCESGVNTVHLQEMFEFVFCGVWLVKKTGSLKLFDEIEIHRLSTFS